MEIWIHPHAKKRMAERGAAGREVNETINEGEQFPVKFGRIGFRRNFSFNGKWRQHRYKTKQVEIIGIKEKNTFVVITVLVKYF